MAQGRKGKYRTGGGLKIGYGYQIPRPYDIVTPRMGDPRQPTTELLDLNRNLGIWDATELGGAPGIPYPKAVDISDVLEEPIKPHIRVAVTDK